MKLGINQPYFFPYIGYYQLISAVDRFIAYEDVNFIKEGWIHRNRLLINNEANLFTIPLHKKSSFKLIKDTEICGRLAWQKQFLRKIEVAYGNAPYFKDIFSLIESVVNLKTQYISKLALESLKKVSLYLELTTEFIESGTIHYNRALKDQERAIDICLCEGANEYINLIGGMGRLSKESFEANNITLKFICSGEIRYKQFNNNFVESLSIIDVLMFNDRETIIGYLNNYKLL